MVNKLVFGEYTPICEEYTVTSKDCGRGVFLLGWLRYNNGDYSFEYYDKATYDIGVRGVVSRKQKIHTGDMVKKYVVGPFAPLPDSLCHEVACKDSGVEFPCYNQWKLFEANWEAYRSRHMKEVDPLGDPLGKTLFWRELTRRVQNA